MRFPVVVSSLSEALELAEDLKRRGSHDWFRGQTRDWRPLRTSLARLGENEKEVARQRLRRFCAWVDQTAGLQGLWGDVDAQMAVAQHYGIPTNYLDFTTEPKVAAWFAAEGSGRAKGEQAKSCIICLNTRDLSRFWSDFAKRDWPEPLALRLDVPDLWRLQAQKGTFLFLPHDDFEQHYFFDRILFPAGEPFDLIPREDIYPERASSLEILLQRYFMLEIMREGDERLRRMAAQTTSVHIEEQSSEGLDRECFVTSDLPALESWSDDKIQDWLALEREDWRPSETAEELTIKLLGNRKPTSALPILTSQIHKILSDHPEIRQRAIIWRCVTQPPLPPQDVTLIEDSLQEFWDGTRRWPFAPADLAHGFGMTGAFATHVANRRELLNLPDDARAAVEDCTGKAIEIEMGLPDSSYSRAFVGRIDLEGAIRRDFWSHLKPRWRSEITRVEDVLQVAWSVDRVIEFRPLAQLFARQIVPSQIVFRQGKVRVYSPAQISTLGLV